MSNRKKKHLSGEAQETSLLSLLRASLKGAAIGLLLSALLALVICVSIIGTANPDALVFPMSLAALYVSAFAAGIIATHKNGGGALLSGLLSGGIFMLSYMLVSLFFPAELSAKYGFLASLLFHVLIVVFSILGGYAATAKRVSPKRKALVRRRSR